jgi:diguanylate cyclase (GGDEF)-like protein
MRSAAPATVRDEWDAAAWAAAQAVAAAVPAFVTGGDGRLVTANSPAAELLGRSELPPHVRALAIEARLKGCVQVVRVSLAHEGGPSNTIDLVLVPLPTGEALAIARDATLETRLVAALASSRDLFRDLALCFTDFAFETDAGGAFSWVSPCGVLGFSAAELHGAQPAQVFGELETNLFSTRERINGRELWVKAKCGRESCIAVTAAPIAGADGAWRGVRGIVRDVTVLRLFEREAALAKKRDDLIGAVVNAVRAQVEPRRMMLAAADALAGATDSDSVTIRMTGIDMNVRVGDTGSGLSQVLEVATCYQGRENGVVRLVRVAAKGGYGAVERSLVDAILPHLGIAIALVRSLEAGTSRRDGLTGLLNRRSFLAEAKRKLAAAARAGRGLGMIVLDCDNLTRLNGSLGEATGDEILSLIGRSLTHACAEGELAGRLDGDEFAVATDAGTQALERGEELRAILATALSRMGLKAELSISAGCAVGEAEADETLDDLIGRAHCALHTAKREGRNRVALAEPQKVMPCSNG